MTSLPEQIFRTSRFTIGAPHDITDNLFLRSGSLWSRDPERVLLHNVNEYAVDADMIACAVNGELHTITNGTTARIPTPGPISHPRPHGTRIAYLVDSALHVTGIDAPLATDVDDYWWSPAGTHFLVASSDESQVDTWQLTDPTEPARPPEAIRYAAVGRPNPVISLAIVDLAGARVDIPFDLEYLITAGWDARGPYAVGQTRDQRTQQWIALDTGTVEHEWHDSRWVQRTPGIPARTASGKLVAHLDRDGTRHLAINDIPVTPEGLQLREVRRIDGERIVFTASVEPTETRCYAYETDLHEIAEPPIRSDVEEPVLTVNRIRLVLGPRALRADLFLPSWHKRGSPLPVLIDSYGGAAKQRVIDEVNWDNLLSQWFAEHGFAVLTIDGAGTPGRGPDWEREVHADSFAPVLDDQVQGLQLAARENPDLDLTRVGIRGWSFGATIAQLAVLRRPDVFHVAVAGAGVTDQRSYNAEWRERFLGHPDEHPERYDAYYLPGEAPSLTRPLLLMHGLSDSNVFPLHTMRMSAALLAAGKPHEVILLPGIGHRAIGSSATEGILLAQLDFLRRHLLGDARDELVGG
ncbi:MAG TPA: prolyl oligopeptidase family serine peptidase [Pseudonocardiaceae bacterium]